MVVSLNSRLESNKEEEEDLQFLVPRACIHQFFTSHYLRLTDSCLTQLKAQGPSRTCNESKEEEVCEHLQLFVPRTCIVTNSSLPTEMSTSQHLYKSGKRAGGGLVIGVCRMQNISESVSS